MNIDEVVEIFKQAGWTPKLRVDHYAEKEVDDRIVRILFKFKDLGVCQKFEASYSIKNAEFSSAVKEVEGGRSEYNDLLKVCKNKARFQGPKITREHIEMTCTSAIAWAMSVDISQRYEALCDLDPSTPGAAGVWHLAALALKKCTGKLTSYQVRFEAGDDCGFIPFITKTYIDRALELAQR